MLHTHTPIRVECMGVYIYPYKVIQDKQKLLVRGILSTGAKKMYVDIDCHAHISTYQTHR